MPNDTEWDDEGAFNNSFIKGMPEVKVPLQYLRNVALGLF